jgi:hypothetical protein
MQVVFHPDVTAFDVPMMQKALRKRGITLDFGPAWKAFQQAVAAQIAERKPAAWETGAEDEERFYRLIVPFSDLRINAYLQLKEERILVWILEVGGRMDVPYNLGKRRDVAQGGVAFTYAAGKFGQP